MHISDYNRQKSSDSKTTLIAWIQWKQLQSNGNQTHVQSNWVCEHLESEKIQITC